jgi:UrcA family protein
MKAISQLAFSYWLYLIIGTTSLHVVCVIGSAAALAGSEVDASVARSAKVSIAGLDLSTPQGASAARERLRQTARKLCAQVADELDLSQQANYLACIDQSVAKAMQQVAPASIVAARRRHLRRKRARSLSSSGWNNEGRWRDMNGRRQRADAIATFYPFGNR